MKTLLSIIFSVFALANLAQDIPHMNGRINYLDKGDYYAESGDEAKAISAYLKGMKKNPFDSVAYHERIAALEQPIASIESDQSEAQEVEESKEVTKIKIYLFDLESHKKIDGGIILEDASGVTINYEQEDRSSYELRIGRKYLAKGSKEGYYEVEREISISQEEIQNTNEFLLSTSKVKTHDKVRVLSGSTKRILDVSDDDFITIDDSDEIDFAIQPVFFEFDKCEVSEQYKLISLVSLLKKYEHLELDIVGFTDSRGSKTYNQNLSEKRALSVLEILKRANISEERMKVVANGEAALESCTEGEICDEDGHSKNRRVDFILRSTLKK